MTDIEEARAEAERLVDLLAQADEQGVEFPEEFAPAILQSDWLRDHDAEVERRALRHAQYAVEGESRGTARDIIRAMIGRPASPATRGAVCAWCPSLAHGTAIWQGTDRRAPSCGVDGHGLKFERTETSAASDSQVLAAANAYMHYQPPYEDLGAFSAQFLDDLRAALLAAFTITEKGDDRG